MTDTRTTEAQNIIEAISYEPFSGTFTWRVDRPESHYKRHGYYLRYMRDKAGKAVKFSSDSCGYHQAGICGKTYQAQVIAIVAMTGGFPEKGLQVDHIDGDPTNNKYNNLRVVTASQNKRNSRKYKNNSSGLTGVCWNSSQSMWYAQVHFDGKRQHLGYFESLLDAAVARISWMNQNGAQHHYTQRHGQKEAA